MIRFDLPTVIAYAGVMSCMMGLILGFIGRDRTASIEGLNFWAAATMVAGMGTLTRILLRNFTSDAVAIGAQNVCLILTAALFLAGSCEFFDHRFAAALSVVAGGCVRRSHGGVRLL